MKKYQTDDWRLTGQERYLKGAHLTLMRFQAIPENPRWDHEHCEFCMCKIAADPKEFTNELVIGEAYATSDRKRWVCPACFSDFEGEFEFTQSSK